MEFIDLKQQYQLYKEEFLSEMDKVLSNARFIKGPVLSEFEEKLARHTGSGNAIGCASGTDALMLGLLAYDVKAGDEVLVPDFTFIATAEVVSLLGAVPVFVDVKDDTLNIDPEKIEAKITPRTKGIIAVSLYGQCADFDKINKIAEKHGVWVIEDGAQSYGAEYKGRKSCILTEIGTTSFFPAKPLGCYGDGGAVFTDNDQIAERLRMLLNHGQEKRYRHKIIGLNSRLDALQAAVLIVKLRHFDEEMEKKRIVAAKYTEKLSGSVKTPVISDGNVSVWAQYTVRSENRESIIESLKEKSVPTAIHYPIPLHKQEAFAEFGHSDADYPVSMKASGEVFSLPMHAYLTDEEIDLICSIIKEKA